MPILDERIVRAHRRYPLAEESGFNCAGKPTPFLFATGYGELPEPYCDRPMLKKPFQMDGLKRMLQSALDSGTQ